MILKKRTPETNLNTIYKIILTKFEGDSNSVSFKFFNFWKKREGGGKLKTKKEKKSCCLIKNEKHVNSFYKIVFVSDNNYFL